MNLRHMEYFCAIVDEGSISAAARQLRIAQPTLTLALRSLERELGVDVLIRSSTGVTLTDAGLYYHGEAKRILHAVSRAAEHMAAVSAGVAGRISLAVTPSYGWVYLPKVLRRLGAAAPDLQVTLHDPRPGEIINLVSAGACDLGIIATSDLEVFRSRHATEFCHTVVRELPLAAFVPSMWSRATEVVGFDEFRERPWVVPMSSPSFPGLAALLERLWREHGWMPAALTEVSTSQAVLPAVSGGLGVGLMPRSFAALAASSVVVQNLIEDIPPLKAVAIWRRDWPLSPAGQLVLNLLGRDHDEPEASEEETSEQTPR